MIWAWLPPPTPVLSFNATRMAAIPFVDLDIAFVSKSRAPEPLEFTWYETGPDLAVEVISPDNRAGDIHLKVMQLLNAGTRLIWLIYPESRTIVAHTTAGANTLNENDTLSGGDVLPGFELRVNDLFPS